MTSRKVHYLLGHKKHAWNKCDTIGVALDSMYIFFRGHLRWITIQFILRPIRVVQFLLFFVSLLNRDSNADCVRLSIALVVIMLIGTFASTGMRSNSIGNFLLAPEHC